MDKLVRLYAEKIVNKQVFEEGLISKDIFDRTNEAIMLEIDNCDGLNSKAPQDRSQKDEFAKDAALA